MSRPPRTPQGVRQRNLSTLLQTLYLEGAQPRSALTRSSGLNRSTVADLVGELVDLGLVAERDPLPSKSVGRPSPIAAPHPDVLAIAVNPEVDALEIAAVRLTREVALKERITTRRPLPAAEVAERVGTVVAEWRQSRLSGCRLAGVGFAVPGIVRRSDGVVRLAPHLDWHEAPLGELAARETGLPVSIANDASLGAAAENRFGAARDCDDAVYLNGGASGIGGGIIVNGAPLEGASGYAGEIGHNLFSGGEAQGVAALESIVNRRRMLDALGLENADDIELGARLAAELAAPPDDERAARRAAIADELQQQRVALATAVASAANILNPSVVVLGGFLSVIRGVDPGALRREVRARTLRVLDDDLRIASASLGEDRLLIGAADAVFSRLIDGHSPLRAGGGGGADR